ncbi:hypothetical protein LINPERHAP1_LOCUS28618 [Linum perenne]
MLWRDGRDPHMTLEYYRVRQQIETTNF